MLIGDHVILPTSILEGLKRDGLIKNDDIGHLCFEITKPLSQSDSRLIQEARLYGKPIPKRKLIYCSVKEFTAPSNTAILAHWVSIISVYILTIVYLIYSSHFIFQSTRVIILAHCEQ